ncbi:MAG: response regulator [Oligoflexales bacterium]|nr:response regulator [Oligoflexales bacterium]
MMTLNSYAEVSHRTDCIEHWIHSFKKTMKIKDDAGGIHLAVVDDDPGFLLLFRRTANSQGILVDTFNTPSHFLKCYSSSLYDAAVIDYNLQHSVNGLEFANCLYTLPVVLISDCSSAAKIMDVEAYWPATIRSFVSKQKGVQKILNETKKAVRDF